MKTEINDGSVVVAPATRTASAGAGMLIGTNCFGVLIADATNAVNTAVQRLGRFTMACVTTDTPAVGASLYWDNTNFRLTTTSAGNRLVGFCGTTKSSGPAVVDVILAGNLV